MVKNRNGVKENPFAPLLLLRYRKSHYFNPQVPAPDHIDSIPDTIIYFNDILR